ncbi:unnamed protein product [Leptidea sinapis]|uniref:Anoctamin n=1 Tax=Leptidea sinapis TaxID=189913 RepID=A0A5E4QPP8_9NEOP|nr:unnamed protein product [Leptidea sinapis]
MEDGDSHVTVKKAISRLNARALQRLNQGFDKLGMVGRLEPTMDRVTFESERLRSQSEASSRRNSDDGGRAKRERLREDGTNSEPPTASVTVNNAWNEDSFSSTNKTDLSSDANDYLESRRRSQELALPGTPLHEATWKSADSLVSDNTFGSALANIIESPANKGLDPDSLMFRDGRRRIDMVLAYEEEDFGVMTEAEARKRDHRRIFQGLELELENKSLSFDGKTWFLKIHIPWKTEMRLAEVIGMKLPTKRFITISVKAWSDEKQAEKDKQWHSKWRRKWKEFYEYDHSKIEPQPSFYASTERPGVRREEHWGSDDFSMMAPLYFCWLGFYTKMLYAPAIVGTLCFLYGLATTTFLELWKRKQFVLRWEWDLGGVDQDEDPRPEFEASVKTYRTNPVTREKEPFLPPWQKTMRYVATSSAVLFMIYGKVAVFLTNIENPRTQTEYEDSYTFKIFFFEFINFYSSLIYIAFFKLHNWWRQRSHRAVTRDPQKPHMAWEQDYHLQDPGRLALFDEYLEMKIRLDAYKMAFVIAYTSDFIPRMVYKYVYSADNTLAGYIDHSLSLFNTSDYREEWGADENEHVVFGLTGLMQLFIPDIPPELKTQMQREMLLAKEAKYEHGRRRLSTEYRQLISQKNENNNDRSGVWFRRTSRASDSLDAHVAVTQRPSSPQITD